MASSPDSYPVSSPDSRRNRRASLDSAAPDHLSGADPFALGLGAALDLCLAAKAADPGKAWSWAATVRVRAPHVA
jgi:hypothetical protein